MDSFEKAIKVLRDKSASEDAKDLAEAVIRDAAKKQSPVAPAGPQLPPGFPTNPFAPYIGDSTVRGPLDLYQLRQGFR